ncbi:uncharacterized protein TNCV_2212961 [Trichonephila clavipes]|nr:uncharacterized protein TNCV_2212961 [Trichonephila clavipes]
MPSGRKCTEEFSNNLNFDLNSTEPSSEKICCALILLPLLLPQRVQEKWAQETKNLPYKFSNVGLFH